MKRIFLCHYRDHEGKDCYILARGQWAFISSGKIVIRDSDGNAAGSVENAIAVVCISGEYKDIPTLQFHPWLRQERQLE